MAGAGDSKFGKKQEGAEFFLLKLFVALKIRKMCNLEGNVALFDAPNFGTIYNLEAKTIVKLIYSCQ